MKAWGQTGSEFHALREYVPGDDLRRINWKASARSDDLMVRETALEGVRRCTVVLDTSAAEYDVDAFERAVVGRGEPDVRRQRPPASHALRRHRASTSAVPTSPVNALRWLATVETTEPRPPSRGAVGRGPSEGIGLVVVVTGSAGSPAVAAARARPDAGRRTRRRRGCAAARPARAMVVDASSLARARRVSWTALVVGNRSRVPA